MSQDVVNVVVLDIYEEGFTVDAETGAQKAVEWITWAKRGTGFSLNAASVTDKVARIRRTNPNLWVELEKSYKAWKSGQNVPDNETALGATSLFSKHQIELLRGVHVTSVEQLAKLNDSDLQNLGFGGGDLRVKARHFVENRHTGDIAAKLAARDAEMEQMRARMAELEAANANRVAATITEAAPVAATLTLNGKDAK